MNIEFVRELTLPHLLQAGRNKFIAAASGLVKAHGNFYAVADDEHYLVRIPEDAKIPCQTYPVFSGSLPLEKKKRKKKKPDLEAITFVEPNDQLKYGALLLIPSGSEPNRTRGALWAFASADKLANAPREINFSDLYSEISKHLGNLNIEGAVINGRDLKLFNRGNGHGTKNAVIEVVLDFSPFTVKLVKTTSIDLGKDQGHPIAFTDATQAKNGDIYFLAVAEATQSSYEDGKLVSAHVGKLGNDNQVRSLKKADFKRKPEGIFIDETDGSGKFYFVTDADDENTPSHLLVSDLKY
jgi:hypothetical protein